MRIFIIEDDVNVRKHMSKTITWAYPNATVTSASKIDEIDDTRVPDIVIIDTAFHLPRKLTPVDFWEARGTQIILSGHTANVTTRRWHLLKRPFSSRVLLEVLQRVMTKSVRSNYKSLARSA